MYQVIKVNGQRYFKIPAEGSRPAKCEGCCFHYNVNGCSAPDRCPCGGPHYPEQNGKWIKY